jgi:hypothetical protein
MAMWHAASENARYSQRQKAMSTTSTTKYAQLLLVEWWNYLEKKENEAYT